MVLDDNEMPGLCAPACELHVASSGAEVVQNLYNVVERGLRACQREKRPIIMGLSGGSLVHTMMDVLPSLNEDYLERLRFVFCDERRVPFDNLESTYGQYAKFVLPRLQPSVSKDQFLCVNPYLKAEESAKDYESKLRQLVGGVSQWPEMDVVLLGVGEDGHTCSLFPGHPVLMEDRFWVAPVSEAPKIPSERITLTLPVLNRARNIIFVVTGASKATVVKKIFEGTDENKTGDKSMPASLVKPVNCGTRVHWILDKAAASLLSTSIMESENTEL